MAWAAFCAHAHRLRVAGFGAVLGVETEAAARRLVDGGVDPIIAEDLLAACERGLVTAYNEKDSVDGGTD